MAAKYHQISLKETFDSCQDMFIDDTPFAFYLQRTTKFLWLLNLGLHHKVSYHSIKEELRKS